MNGFAKIVALDPSPYSWALVLGFYPGLSPGLSPTVKREKFEDRGISGNWGIRRYWGNWRNWRDWRNWRNVGIWGNWGN